MATPHPRSRTGRVVLAALAAAAGVGALIAARDEGPAMTTATAAPTARAAVTRARVPARARPAGGLDPEMLSAAALRDALAAYERDSVYPPSSHRWTEETAGQRTPWNQPFPVEHLLDDRPGQETVFRLASDRHHVAFGEALTSTIEVAPADRRRERLPVTIRSAIVEAAGQGRTGITLAYRDDGQGGDAVAGDRVYTNRFVPSEQVELGAARQVRLQVHLEAAGVDRLAHLDFTYTPRPLLELVGVATAVEDGALAIDLDLDVFEAGAYRFDADVLAADGETPVGWITEPWIELGAGRARVDLALFGKVLRDRGLAGPYVIANLRAERRQDDADVEMWWSDPRTFRTDAFALEAFSPEAWDGDERRAAIAAIQQAIAEQERAERGDYR